MIVNEYPIHFLGLGTLPMQDEKKAITELERCIKELGLTGIQIGSNINGLNLNEPSVLSIFEVAREMGASVFVHPWDIMGKDEMEKYWLSWLVGMPAESSRAFCSMIFGGVFKQLPDLRVAFAHGGGAFPATVGRIQHGFNVRPDLCAIDNKYANNIAKKFCDSNVMEIKMMGLIACIIYNHSSSLKVLRKFSKRLQKMKLKIIL